MTLTAWLMYLMSFFAVPVAPDRSPPPDAEQMHARGADDCQPPVAPRGVVLDISNGF